MKKANSHILLWWILLLLIIPASSYVGYRYGYKKAVKTEIGKKQVVSKKSKEVTEKADVSKEVKQISKEKVIKKQKEKKKIEQKESAALSCEEARQNILEFISYLNQKDYLKKYYKEKEIKEHISSFLKKLSQNPPNPEGEGMNSEIMINNIYHLFRTLSVNDIRMIRDIIRNESDQIEYIMRWYYIWLVSQDKCPDSYDILPSIKTAYIYASFFLNTIGGRSYLFRRSNPLRLLLSYYCVLIIWDMSEKGKNIYGVNISPIAQELKDELTRLEAEKITLEATEIKIEKTKAPVGIKGSVGNADISTAIAEQLNIGLDKKHINLKKALKSEGIHEVDAKLGHGIHANLKLEVLKN